MNKTKSRNTVIITICIASALICIALTFWGNWKNNGVLTTDAFIGVMATFIGICATIIVGVQIVNHLEIRNIRKSITAIEEERNSLNYEKEAFSVEMYNTRLSIGNALALLALTAQKNNDFNIEFTSWVHSIIIDDWNSMKGSALLNRYKRLIELSNILVPVSDKVFLEEAYKALSVIVVPKEIEHYNEIMSLHYKLLTDIKKSIQTTPNSNDN
ncbi:MAG: hypothetical protein J6T81_00065 [Bacteroidales bacterium]|nr:hypothetical protein [Bacteroidales bacterium]